MICNIPIVFYVIAIIFNVLISVISLLCIKQKGYICVIIWTLIGIVPIANLISGVSYLVYLKIRVNDDETILKHNKLAKFLFG